MTKEYQEWNGKRPGPLEKKVKNMGKKAFLPIVGDPIIYRMFEDFLGEKTPKLVQVGATGIFLGIKYFGYFGYGYLAYRIFDSLF